MNIIDYVILAILAIHLLYGAYRGFVSSLLSLGSCILAIVLSFMFFPQLVDGISANADIVGSLSYFTGAEALLKNVSNAGLEIANLDSTNLSLVLDHLQLPKPLDSVLLQNIQQEVFQSTATLTLGDYVVQTIIGVAIHIFSFIVVFLLIYFAFSIVLNLLKGIFRFPALRFGDAALGGLIGLVRGVLFVFVFFSSLPLLPSMLPIEEVRLLINQSELAPFFYNPSFIISILNRQL